MSDYSVHMFPALHSAYLQWISYIKYGSNVYQFGFMSPKELKTSGIAENIKRTTKLQYCNRH